jgi:hypothetical protein
VSGLVEGEGGNAQVSPILFSDGRGDRSGGAVGAHLKEGGSWGKHGFPHGSGPKARDEAAHKAVELAA